MPIKLVPPSAMPYAVVTSSLGALVATGIAVFGLHSWPAFKIAPFIGGLLGAGFSLAVLRLHGLPLLASVEEYRDAAGIAALEEISPIYFKFAMAAALAVSIVEVAGLLIDPVTVLSCWSLGWVVITSYTFWRAWQLNHPAALGRFDIIQIFGGVGFLMISGLFLYFPFDGSVILDRAPDNFSIIKAIFIINAWATGIAMVIALFGVNFLRRLSTAAGLQ
jgi:hypothetical protein